MLLGYEFKFRSVEPRVTYLQTTPILFFLACPYTHVRKVHLVIQKLVLWKAELSVAGVPADMAGVEPAANLGLRKSPCFSMSAQFNLQIVESSGQAQSKPALR